MKSLIYTALYLYLYHRFAIKSTKSTSRPAAAKQVMMIASIYQTVDYANMG